MLIFETSYPLFASLFSSNTLFIEEKRKGNTFSSRYALTDASSLITDLCLSTYPMIRIAPIRTATLFITHAPPSTEIGVNITKESTINTARISTDNFW